MISERADLSRRHFVGCMLAGLGLLGAVASPRARTQEERLPKLTEDDPTALRLGYVTDAARVDTSAYPHRAAEAARAQFCKTCQFYIGDVDANWGPCVVFPDKLVSTKGWCSNWRQKTG